MAVFQLERGQAALDKYAAVNHLTVQVYDGDGAVVVKGAHPTPLYDVFVAGHGPGMFAACARRCLDQPGPAPGVIVEERYGLAVVGTPLVLAGAIVGAAVA